MYPWQGYRHTANSKPNDTTNKRRTKTYYNFLPTPAHNRSEIFTHRRGKFGPQLRHPRKDPGAQKRAPGSGWLTGDDVDGYLLSHSGVVSELSARLET